jgi:pilus assembly protein Flp/PilA
MFASCLAKKITLSFALAQFVFYVIADARRFGVKSEMDLGRGIRRACVRKRVVPGALRCGGRGQGRTSALISSNSPWHGRKEQRRLQMKNLVTRFIKSEDGPTATEYAVMLALIIIVALGAITLLGNKVNTIFTNVESTLPDGT